MRWRNPLVGLCAGIAVCGVAKKEDFSEPQTGEVIYGYACLAGPNSPFALLTLGNWSAVKGLPEGCAVVADPRPWPYSGDPAFKCSQSVEPPKGCFFSAELSAALQSTTTAPPAATPAAPPVASPPAAQTPAAVVDEGEKPADALTARTKKLEEDQAKLKSCGFDKPMDFWAVGESVVERGHPSLFTFARDKSNGNVEFLELLQEADGAWRFYLVIVDLQKDGAALAKIPEPYLTIRVGENAKILGAMQNGFQTYISAEQDWMPLKKNRIAINVTSLFAGNPEKLLERGDLTMLVLKHVEFKDLKPEDEYRWTYMQMAGLRDILNLWKGCFPPKT